MVRGASGCQAGSLLSPWPSAGLQSAGQGPAHDRALLNTRVFNAKCALQHCDLLHVLVRFALGMRCNEIPGKSLFRRQPLISCHAQLWHQCATSGIGTGPFSKHDLILMIMLMKLSHQ